MIFLLFVEDGLSELGIEETEINKQP
jgi:hypothetical protein